MKRSLARLTALLAVSMLPIAACSDPPSAAPSEQTAESNSTPLPLGDWLTAFCEDAAVAAQYTATLPELLNPSAEEVGAAQAFAAEVVERNQLSAQAWGRPLETDIELLPTLANYNAAAAAWGADWWAALREQMRALEPEGAVALWRATTEADETFDRDTLLSLNTDPLPDPPALDENFERDSAELGVQFDKYPGCSENSDYLHPIVPSGALEDSE